MNKSFRILAGVLSVCCMASAVKASEYGLCINRSGPDWRRQMVCEQEETRRLMRQITNLYARMASEPHFKKLNTGKTSLNEQFKQWQSYRNSYCAYWEAAKSGYGDEAYAKAECLRILTSKHYDDLQYIINAATAVKE